MILLKIKEVCKLFYELGYYVANLQDRIFFYEIVLCWRALYEWQVSRNKSFSNKLGHMPIIMM